jgi:hypothetical protein
MILFDEIIQIFDLKNFNKAYNPGKHQQEVNILQPNGVAPLLSITCPASTILSGLTTITLAGCS